MVSNITILLLLISLFSTRLSLGIPYAVILLIYLLLIVLLLRYLFKTDKTHCLKEYLPINIYSVYIVISIVFGYFIASGYWMWKQFIINQITLLFILFLYYFSNPYNVSYFLKKWLKYAIIAFIPFSLFMTKDSYGIYLGPIILLLIYLKYIPIKYRIVLLIFSLLACSDFGARSIFLKFIPAILLGIPLLVNIKIPKNIFNILSIIFFITPIIFFILGITGIYNIFQYQNNSSKQLTQTKINKKGERVEENLLADTRTFIYRSVLSSSVANNSILFGTTPAKSAFVEEFDNEITRQTGRKNECGIANLYTWCGAAGVILMMFIYMQAIRLAINHSKNYSLQLLGVYIAYRWIIFWIEDIQNPTIDNVTLHIIIAIAYSKTFRNMSETRFKLFISNLFKVK